MEWGAAGPENSGRIPAEFPVRETLSAARGAGVSPQRAAAMNSSAAVLGNPSSCLALCLRGDCERFRCAALHPGRLFPTLLLSDPANVRLNTGQKGSSVLFPTSVSSPGIFNSSPQESVGFIFIPPPQLIKDLLCSP